ncbi:MAG: 30S ribosomal protein S8 [Candidatus Aenigmarchaeota archaeon]|nr:30S ribosomal protein S8 [Candidatus Aenigmarchaeota archaeon]
MRHDTLADCLSIIKNAETIGREECLVPSTKLIKDVLKVMKENKYIKGYEPVGQHIKVMLSKKINNCNVIKPRFSFKKNEFEKWEKRYLPAKAFGILIVTTSKGIMDHNKAKKEQIGGKLLGYVY